MNALIVGTITDLLSAATRLSGRSRLQSDPLSGEVPSAALHLDFFLFLSKHNLSSKTSKGILLEIMSSAVACKVALDDSLLPSVAGSEVGREIITSVEKNHGIKERSFRSFRMVGIPSLTCNGDAPSQVEVTHQCQKGADHQG
jgi:hypothetical protein